MKWPKRVTIKVRRLPHGDGLPLPAYQSQDAAGLDLVAAVPEQTPIVLAPGARASVPTGLALELPSGTEAQVRPRSGLAIKHGVTVLNSPGTIDADYRGEVAVILINHGHEPFMIQRGERIAQLVIATTTHARLIETKALTATERGDGGFGSTGTTDPSKAAPPPQKRKVIARKAAKTKISRSKTAKRKPR